MKPTILTLLLLMAVGCAEHEGEIVKSYKTGKLYRLDWRIGKCYVPLEIDSTEITSLKKAIGDTIK